MKMKVLESQRSSNYVRRDMRRDSATENGEKRNQRIHVGAGRSSLPWRLGCLFSFFLSSGRQILGICGSFQRKGGKKTVAGRGAAARPLDPPPPTVPHRPWPSVARSASLVPGWGLVSLCGGVAPQRAAATSEQVPLPGRHASLRAVLSFRCRYMSVYRLSSYRLFLCVFPVPAVFGHITPHSLRAPV